MKTRITLLYILVFVLFSIQTIAQTEVQKKDSLLYSEVIDKLIHKKEMPAGQLLAKVAKTFLETPYVAHTLEDGKEENLIINLREFDCTTFVENCLAITNNIKSGETSFSDFKETIEKIRYRDGKRDGYCSRLHYFSEWVNNNQQKGFVEIQNDIPYSPFNGKVNFMSEHPNSYEVLKENPELVKIIEQQEKQISEQKLFFLPRSEIEKNEPLLKDGDIVGLATSIPGLDIVHVGIVVTKDNRKHLLHASSSEMKVVISDNTLHDFLQQKKHYTGILVVSPKF